MNDSLRSAFAQAIATCLNRPVEDILAGIGVPADVKHGHLSFPCFGLSKELRKAPVAIALELLERVVAPEGCEILATGPYLNLKVMPAALARSTVQLALNTPGPVSLSGSGKTVLIDYSSPNIGKELVYHHIRSTVIGASLARLYAAAGWNVVAVNHLGDWGTQFGKLTLMFLREHGMDTAKAIAALPEVNLATLNRLYVGFKPAAELEPALEDEARDWFRKIEANDPVARACWARFVEATREELTRLYTDLDARFDHYLGESFYEDKLGALVERLDKAGILEESEGAQVVKVGDDVPPCLIRKKDGSTLYATRDLAAATWRHEKFGFDRCLYVVDAGQSLHFRQVFRVLERLQDPSASKCVHIPFGLVLGRTDDGGWAKTSTRMGGGTPLRDVMNSAIDRIRQIVSERNPDLPDPESLSKALGLGALVFNELKSRRTSDSKFDLDLVLSFEGDTGPYVQYAYVRLCGILRKAGDVIAPENARWELLCEPETEKLLVTLDKLPERVDLAIEQNEPSILAQYCLEVAEAFHHFYSKHRVLEHEASPERLLLVQATQAVLGRAMKLVGLTPVERM